MANISGGELVPCPNCGIEVYKWLSPTGKTCWYEAFGPLRKGKSYRGRYPDEPSRVGHKCSIWVSHHCCNCCVD